MRRKIRTLQLTSAEERLTDKLVQWGKKVLLKAITVSSFPWVNTTILCLLVLTLGRAWAFFAISLTSLVYRQKHMLTQPVDNVQNTDKKMLKTDIVWILTSLLTSNSCSLANVAASWETKRKRWRFIFYIQTPVCVWSTQWLCAESLTDRLVAEQHVNVGHDLHEVVLEELADEGCGEVQAKHLVIFGRVLRHFQDGLEGDGQEETLGGRTKGSRLICFFFFILMDSNESEQCVHTMPLLLLLSCPNMDTKQNITRRTTHSDVEDFSFFDQLPVFLQV